MNIFQMRGAWGGLTARLYEAVVADGIGPLYERLVTEIEERIPHGGRVLDVGCGPGHVASALARRRSDLTVLGVDLSETMVARARAGRDRPSNLSFREGNAMDLGFEDASFDAAISVASIKHWPDRARGVREMARVVRPGGMVGVVEADPACSRQAARNFAAYWKWIFPGTRPAATWYFRRFVAGQGVTSAELGSLFEQAHLGNVEARAMDDQPVAVALGVRAEG